MHTSLKRIASARHSNSRKIVLTSRMHASNKTVIEDEEDDDVFSRRPLYCGRAGSNVIGLPLARQVVFFVCMLQTRITLTAFPHSDP